MDAPFPVPSEDVLAQPTRARLFALLIELKRAAGTVELAARLDLHPNGVRNHLERMEQAGLVARERARKPTPGRPRDGWTIAPNARPGGEPPRAYSDLGRWLARAIPPRPGSLRDIEAAGREIGREIAPANAETAGTDALQSTLVALGFQPTREQAPDRVTLCLGNCPYRDAVRENQPVICTLHRGITLGLLDVLEPDGKLIDFVPRDPDTAGCLIELGGVSPGPADK